MGNYDVKWRAYERAMKNDPNWQRLSKAEKREQFGRYAAGLQRDEQKTASKLFGKKLGKEIAKERAEKTKMYEGLFDQIDKHNANQTKYDELFGLRPADTKFQPGSGNFSGHYTTVTPDNHNEMQHFYNTLWGETDGTRYRDALEGTLDGRMSVNVNPGETIDRAARQADLDAAFGLKPARPNFPPTQGLKPTDGTISAIIPDNHDEMQHFYNTLWGETDGTRYRDALERTLDGRMSVNVNPGETIDRAARQADLDAVFGLKPARPNFPPTQGLKPTDGTISVTIDPIKHTEQQKLYEELFGQADDIVNPSKIDWKKIGKYGAIALGVIALTGLGIWAAKKIKENKEAKEAEQNNDVPVDNNNGGKDVPVKPVVDDSTKVPVLPVLEDPEIEDEDVTVDTTIKIDDTPIVVPPLKGKDDDTTADGDKDSVDNDGNNTTVKPDNDKDTSIKVDGKKYTVKKGDNVWNIAKKHLREELGREPKLSEIKAKEQEIMKENNLKFEADGYVCIIKPDQELKVA